MRGCFFIITYSLLFFSGCNYNVIKSGSSNNTLEKAKGGENLPHTATLDWNLIQGSVLSSCNDCHSGLQNPNLSSMGLMVQNISKVFDKVSNGIMPPQDRGYTRLSPCKVQALKKWIEMGEPIESTTLVSTIPECLIGAPPRGEVTPIKDQPLSYQVLLTQVLQVRCMKCHAEDNPTDAADTLFFPFSEIQNNTRDWSPPGATSKVIDKLTRTDDKRMPPPRDSAPLDPDTIDYIKRWIDAGKPL